ncbi:hypothetical protein [Haloglomus irregulare]|uniref:hypothetical protein n=1 Tax=Haloglomus irregulare TaxID=2234134 RepID=UPI00163D5994|nr:hypothetical protein [Haloglomus irregulare]
MNWCILAEEDKSRVGAWASVGGCGLVGVVAGGRLALRRHAGAGVAEVQPLAEE